MNAYKTILKEEMAIRHWQNVISFGTSNSSSNKGSQQQDKNQVVFEVLP